MLRPKGFSLIEMMIALVIMVILLSMAIPSFSTFIQNRKVRNGAEGVIAGLSLAKSEAIRRNTQVNFTLSSNSSWTVGCTTPVADIDGDGVDDCPALIQSRSDAEGGGGLQATGMTLDFNGYGQIPALTANTNINITNTSGTCVADGGTMRCLRIVVSPGGLIRSCDPQTTKTQPGSPKAC